MNFKAFQQLSRALIRGEIRRTRATLDWLSKSAFKLHLQLTCEIRTDLWTVLDASAALKADGEGRKESECQASKLKKLADKRDVANDDNKEKEDKNIVNLSSHILNNEEVKILKKRLGFAIAPKTVPLENIVCSIEDGIKNLSDEEKDAIRQDCALILKNAKPPKNNISKSEHEAIKNLRNNENIVM